MFDVTYESLVSDRSAKLCGDVSVGAGVYISVCTDVYVGVEVGTPTDATAM